MSMIQYKQKIHNLSRNIKGSLQSFTNNQIDIVKDIINTIFSHGYNNNGQIINTVIYEPFTKIINKYSLTIQNGEIKFPQIPEYADLNYFSKMFSAFLDKTISYLSNNNVSQEQFSDLIELLNNQSISDKTSLKSQQDTQKQIQIAQNRDIILQGTIIHDSAIYFNMNNIQFKNSETQNIDHIRAKLTTGNKQEQIRNSDTTTLVDSQTKEQIIKEIQSDSLNNLYKGD